MKISRIDLEGVCCERVYDSEEDLRLQLVDYHRIDWEESREISNLSLKEICLYGGWRWEHITEKEAVEIMESEDE